jgi:hypothetical protein
MVEVMREVKIPHLYIVHFFFLRIDGVVEFLRILRVHARKHSTMWCYTHAGQDSAVALLVYRCCTLDCITTGWGGQHMCALVVPLFPSYIVCHCHRTLLCIKGSSK